MNEFAFDNLVFVRAGKRAVREIGSAGEAQQYLRAWPGFRGGRLYDLALRACQEALEDRVSPKAARAAFVTWARWVDVLEEADVPSPWMIALSSGREPASGQ